MIGTPAYMAPEQFEGRPADEKTDQFAFAIALHEALYGERPFTGSTFSELEANVLRDVRSPPPDRHVPRAVRCIIRTALASDPDARFRSMSELIAALRRAARPRRRIAIVAAAAGMATLIAAATMLRAGPADPDPCLGADEAWYTVWTDARRDAVTARFRSIGLAPAERIRASLEGRIDELGRAWRASRLAACDAGRASDSVPAELYTLRVTCLRRRLVQLDALLGVFIEADEDVLFRAVPALDEIDLTACSADGVIAHKRLSPADPTDRRRVDQVRDRLATARALLDAGRFQDALARLDDAVIAVVPFRPLQAETRLLRGQILDGLDKDAEAVEALTAAVWTAEAASHDEVALAATTYLIGLSGAGEVALAAGQRWAAHARALLERTGGNLDRRLRIDNALGLLLHANDRFAEAVDSYDRAIATAGKDLATRLGRAHLHNNRARSLAKLGRFQEAAAAYEEAIELFSTVLGDDHPIALTAWSNLASVFSATGDYARALELHRDLLARRRASLGPDHPQIAVSLGNVAVTLDGLGRYAEAVASHEQTLAHWRRVSAHSPNVAVTLGNLALSLSQLGRHDEAVQRANEAVELKRARLGDDHTSVALARAQFAQVLLRAGRSRDALSELSRACPRFESALGRSHPHHAECRCDQGVAFSALGRLATAEMSFRRGMAGLGDTREESVIAARCRFGLARVEWRLGRRAAARNSADRALTSFTGAGLAHEVGEVRRWMAEPTR
jgi:tetratricopeptide (TPR) repeat protein